MNHLNLKKRAMQLAAVLLSLAVLLPSVPAAFASQSAAEGTAVVFSESGITAADESGLSIDGTTLTIEQVGTYVLSGTCSDGFVKVKKGVTGVTLVLLSSLSYAVYIVGVNRSALAALPTVKLTFYALLFGLVIYVVRLDFLTGLQAVPSWYLWGNVLALAALPTAVSLLCTTQAIHYIGSTPTAILGALEPVTAVFFGVVIFYEELTARLGLGIALILVAVTLIVAGGRFASFLLRFRRLFPKRHRKTEA